VSTFRRVLAACSGRATELFTYTCSTANRVALLAAGFFVARGRNAGEKLETTIALTPAAFHTRLTRRREMLTGEWLEKWSRSAAKFPEEIEGGERPAFEKLIREHEQFQSAPTRACLPAPTKSSADCRPA
jgi:queuine tRNA-ribosyltransferase